MMAATRLVFWSIEFHQCWMSSPCAGILIKPSDHESTRNHTSCAKQQCRQRSVQKKNAGKDELQFPIPDHTNSIPGDILSISVLSYLLIESSLVPATKQRNDVSLLSSLSKSPNGWKCNKNMWTEHHTLIVKSTPHLLSISKLSGLAVPKLDFLYHLPQHHKLRHFRGCRHPPQTPCPSLNLYLLSDRQHFSPCQLIQMWGNIPWSMPTDPRRIPEQGCSAIPNYDSCAAPKQLPINFWAWDYRGNPRAVRIHPPVLYQSHRRHRALLNFSKSSAPKPPHDFGLLTFF